MAFKSLFLTHTPDANYEKNRSVIETGRYKLFTVIVKTQEEAIKAFQTLHEKEKIDAIN